MYIYIDILLGLTALDNKIISRIINRVVNVNNLVKILL